MPHSASCERPHTAGRRVTWLELFFDLVFVAAVAQLGSQFEGGLTAASLARYTFLFLLVWWAWNGYAVYATRFGTDDGVQRACALLQMLAVTFMAANAEGDLSSVSSAGFAGAYAAMRLLLVAQYVRESRLPSARRLAREHAVGFGAAAVLWAISAVVPPPLRFALWALALLVDLGTAVVTARHTEMLPPDAEHLPERFGLFTLILLGESMIAIMKGIQHQPEWSVAAASAAFLGMGLVFGYWGWYFHVAHAAAPRHVRTRADVLRYETWNYAHVPLYLGLAVSGLSIEHIVRAGGAEPLHHGEAWLLCGATVAVLGGLSVLRAVSAATVAPGQVLSAHAPLTLLPIGLAVLAPYVPAAAIVVALAATCGGQLLVASRARLRYNPPHVELGVPGSLGP
jgi:low temperature requirement protein LtrA